MIDFDSDKPETEVIVGTVTTTIGLDGLIPTVELYERAISPFATLA